MNPEISFFSRTSYKRNDSELYDIVAAWQDFQENFEQIKSEVVVKTLTTQDVLALHDNDLLILSNDDPKRPLPEDELLPPVLIFDFDGQDRRVVHGIEQAIRAHYNGRKDIWTITFLPEQTAQYRVNFVPLKPTFVPEDQLGSPVLIRRTFEPKSETNPGLDHRVTKLRNTHAAALLHLEQYFRASGFKTSKFQRTQIAKIRVAVSPQIDPQPVPLLDSSGDIKKLYEEAAKDFGFKRKLLWKQALFKRCLTFKATCTPDAWNSFRDELGEIAFCLGIAFHKARRLNAAEIRLLSSYGPMASAEERAAVELEILGSPDEQKRLSLSPLHMAIVAYHAIINPCDLWPQSTSMRETFNSIAFLGSLDVIQAQPMGRERAAHLHGMIVRGIELSNTSSVEMPQKDLVARFAFKMAHQRDLVEVIDDAVRLSKCVDDPYFAIGKTGPNAKWRVVPLSFLAADARLTESER